MWTRYAVIDGDILVCVCLTLEAAENKIRNLRRKHRSAGITVEMRVSTVTIQENSA